MTVRRRTVLKGLGAAIALPYLDAMLPLSATAATPNAFPKRMAFLYVPNGIHMPDWTPASDDWWEEPLGPDDRYL